MARQFMAALKRGDPFCWQTFPDNKQTGNSGAAILHGGLDAIKTRLIEEKLKGRGIFAAVNRTNGRGRTTEHVVAATAVFADGDDIPVPESWPLEPHIITKRSNERWQAFWLIEPTNDFTTWTGIQKRVAACLKTDPSVCDPPRVMRIPGFIHQKGTPIRIELVICPSIEDVHNGSIIRYTIEEMNQAFPSEESEKNAHPKNMTSKRMGPGHGRQEQTPVIEWNWKPISKGVSSTYVKGPHSRLKD